jgi:hypothetical protein
MIKDAKNIVIRNNIIQAYGIANIDGSDSFTILNNTFTSNLSLFPDNPSAVSLKGTTNTSIKNNIFFDIPGQILYLVDNQSKLGLDIDYNCIFKSDGKQPSGSPSS